VGDALRRTVRNILVAAAVLTTPCVAMAEYPERPVRIVVGLTAGSGADLIARLVAEKLSVSLGQPVTVENRPGAGTNLATHFAATQPADGYTIFVATVANAINASLYKRLQFDALRDFAPVILAGSASNVLIVKPSLQAKSVKELIDLAKAQPGKITIGSSGTGTSSQMAGELFRRRAGVDIVHVPYKGGPEAATALIDGQIDTLFAIVSTALPQIESGKVRALAVTSKRRSALLPNVPTLHEAGLADFEAVTWFGFAVRSSTPKDVINKLNREVGKVLAVPDVQQKLAQQGIDIGGGTPEQFGAYMKDEFAKWGAVVKETGMTAD